MAFVDWSEEYSVNDCEMDGQHRRLFVIVNELHKAILAKKSRDEIGNLLNRLAAHAQSHFAAEERLMEVCGYPGYEKNKEEHEKLLHQVGDLESEFRKEAGGMAPGILALLVKDWLLRHILNMDKDYAPSLKPTARCSNL